VRGARSAIWQPSPDEIHLLRAGLWDPPAALEAWEEWRRAGGRDLDTADPGSHRLLPLVYRNLESVLEDRDSGRLRGIYRRSWASNQFAVRAGGRAMRALAEAGVETLVLKGGALLDSAYHDLGARPMGDLDVAVPAKSVGRAVEVLLDAGLAPSDDDPDALHRVRHSQPFKDPDGYELDLHRDVLWRPGLEGELWEASLPAVFAGVQTRRLCAADQVLHVCVHGAPWNPASPVRWAADAAKVIQNQAEELDWDRLTRLAIEARLVPPLLDALSFLAGQLRQPVPANTLEALAAAPVRPSERRAHEALARRPSSGRSAAMAWWFWERYRAQSELDGRRSGPRGFLRYMQGFWGLEGTRQVPSYALRRLARRRAGQS
jgi:hypothetical protein